VVPVQVQVHIFFDLIAVVQVQVPVAPRFTSRLPVDVHVPGPAWAAPVALPPAAANAKRAAWPVPVLPPVPLPPLLPPLLLVQRLPLLLLK